jgi:hypothetical protein
MFDPDRSLLHADRQTGNLNVYVLSSALKTVSWLNEFRQLTLRGGKCGNEVNVTLCECVCVCVRLVRRRKNAGSEILPGSGQLSDENNKGTSGQQRRIRVDWVRLSKKLL